MWKTIALIALALCAAPLLAQSSSFQGTCSAFTFSYGNGSQAILQAWCLQANGVAKSTSVALRGISNQNGTLTVSGSGSSSFQQSCGNIQITANAGGATISALCRTSGGAIQATSAPLNGISNNNGNLTY